MDQGNWYHVAALEAASEEEEYIKWTTEATIEQAERRGYGFSCMKLIDLEQGWHGKVRLHFEKQTPPGSPPSTTGVVNAKRGQIFHVCPSVGFKGASRETFGDSKKIAKGVVVSSNVDNVISLAFEEFELEQLMSDIEEKEDESTLIDSLWDLCLEGSEVTRKLRFKLIQDFTPQNMKPSQRPMYQRLENAIREPKYAPVDPRLIIPPSDTIMNDDELHLPPNFLQPGNKLNKPQLRAIANTLSRPVSCIHGPPGTGKTTTVAELVIGLYNSNKRVLITGPSNISVDNVLRLCMRNEAARKSCVRLGHPARIHTDLQNYTFESLARNNDINDSCTLIREELSACLDIRASGKLNKLTLKELKQRLEDHIKTAASGATTTSTTTTTTTTTTDPPRYTVRQVRRAATTESRILKKELKERESRITSNVLGNHSLVFCTCAGSMRKELADHMRQKGDEYLFDYVIIDEAAKACVLDSLMPCRIGNRLILAGDHKQLRPTIKSKEASRIGLGISLMERLINERVPSVMLEVQYRMNQQLMSWPSNQFYGNALQADSSVADQYLDPSTPGLYWCDTADIDYDLFKETVEHNQTISDPSKYNLAEAIVVRAYIQNLLKKFHHITSIGVISFYQKQVKLLHQYLRSYKFELPDAHDMTTSGGDGMGSGGGDGRVVARGGGGGPASGDDRLSGRGSINDMISVETVDGFQGKEADVIILSMVRSNKNKEIGFLAEATRINVSITRARRHCAIIGDSKTVKENEILGSLFDACTVETCLTQIDLDRIIEDTRDLGIRFRNDTIDGKRRDERDPRSKNHDNGSKKYLKKKIPKRNTMVHDAAFSKDIKTQLEKLSPTNPMVNFTGLSSFKRMLIHEIAGDMKLIHKTSKTKNDQIILTVHIQGYNPSSQEGDHPSDDDGRGPHLRAKAVDGRENRLADTSSSGDQIYSGGAGGGGFMGSRSMQKNRFIELARSTSSCDDDGPDDDEVMALLRPYHQPAHIYQVGQTAQGDFHR